VQPPEGRKPRVQPPNRRKLRVQLQIN
jgi:hypothetical protein